jgi:uncharacterized protein YndB with AHSA1/START domain
MLVFANTTSQPMADTPTPRPAIERTITIAAPRETVFAFLTDPQRMREWMGTTVDIDPRPGGRFRVVPNRVDVIRGEYLEVLPPSRVVFTWGFEGDGQALPAGASVVEITLTEVPGGTELHLVHRAVPDPLHDQHAFGWGHYLERLLVAATGGAPGPDRFADPSIRHGQPPGPAT